MRIEHRPQDNLYVLIDDHGDALGEVEYSSNGSTLLLLRAEVPRALRGQSLGLRLVGRTLEAIRETGGLSVVPVCPYIAKFMMKNKEFDDLKA